jgi:hypothetical protein
VLCPDRRLIVLHQFAGSNGNICPAGHHPRADTHALWEHYRALGGALPQGTGEIPVGQGQDVGQGNDVGGVAVVGDTVCAIGGSLADAVVHKVAGELAGRLCTALQAPDDAPAVALFVDLHDADAVHGIRLHVAEELARAGGGEILPGQIICLHAHVHPTVQAAAAHNLLADLLRFIVKQHHMVGVPADGAGDVEGNLREEGQQGRNLVADHFGGMVVAVIHQRNALFPVEGGVAQGKLGAAHGVCLHPDAEHLALDAGLAVFHPEFPGLLVGTGKGQRVALGMGEKGGVEVCAQPSCLAEIHPFFEVLRLQFVPVYPRVFLVKNGVGSMEIDLFGAGAEGQHSNVGTVFFAVGFSVMMVLDVALG